MTSFKLPRGTWILFSILLLALLGAAGFAISLYGTASAGWGVSKELQQLFFAILILLGLVILFLIIAIWRISRHFLRNQKNKRLALLNQSQFEALFNQSSDATWILNRSGEIMEVNKIAIDLFKVTQKEVEGVHITDPSLWPMEMTEMIPSAVRKGLTSGRAVFEVSVDVLGNGLTRLEGQILKVESDLGDTFLVFSLRDITVPYLKSEDAGLIGALNSFFERGEDLASIVEGVFAKLRDHFGFSQETYWQLSPDREKLLPSQVRALVDDSVSIQPGAEGISLNAGIATDLAAKVFKTRLSKYIAHDSTSQYDIAFPYVLDKKVVGVLEFECGTGTRKPEMMLEPLRLCIVQLAFQIEKFKVEEEVRLSESLSMTGRLARAIAHEVRNPLTNILLSARQLEKSLEEDKTGLMMLDIIKRNSERINNLITDLLESSKPSVLEIEPTSIFTLIAETQLLFQDRIVLRKIELELDLPSEDLQVNLDSNKMKTAILNIVTNAIEAMAQTESPHLTIGVTETPDHVTLRIQDNGIGMSPKAVSRLFDPFFTGKKSGMGLGMTTTKNILDSHKAKVRVESTLGEGTTFFIDLPK